MIKAGREQQMLFFMPVEAVNALLVALQTVFLL